MNPTPAAELRVFYLVSARCAYLCARDFAGASPLFERHRMNVKKRCSGFGIG
jgi:hypothetical protein